MIIGMLFWVPCVLMFLVGGLREKFADYHASRVDKYSYPKMNELEAATALQSTWRSKRDRKLLDGGDKTHVPV